jgi:hypothetical protein
VAESSDSESIDTIRAQADSIARSGVLGRSRFYKALLEYLVECAARGHAPKEIEIAAEVFNRGSGFDPSQDSMVRVYAHNLRQKLQQYYREAGRNESLQLTVPKGEYRIVLTEPGAASGPPIAEAAGSIGQGRSSRLTRAFMLVVIGVIVGIVAARFGGMDDGALAVDARDVAASPYWSGILDDDVPIIIVAGDYFIFGEADTSGMVDRLVRDFSINSSEDLDDATRLDPGLANRYIDLDLTYLPTSSAFALSEFLRVVHTTGKTVRVVPMSNLDAMDIRDNHVIYVGYLSALDKLFDFVFTGSELAIGRTYDELVNTVTGERFQSEAGIPSGGRNYRDYALVSVFPGPNGNEFMILAGTRDEGLMHSAQAVSDPSYVDMGLARLQELPGGIPPAFEILYEVTGFGRTNLDATIVHVAPVEQRSIWSDEISLP